jgi:hypothetical protein
MTPLTRPKIRPKLVPKQHIVGPPITPLQRLELFSADEFEEFVEEWAFGFVQNEYVHVQRSAGAGDKGRDIIGYMGDLASDAPRDVYQCKHYDDALTPSVIWVELGKLCYYSFRGDYRVPRRLYFIAPKGVGAKLHGFIEDPVALRTQLIKEWPTSCQKQITKECQVIMEGDLRAYVEAFDFSIIGYKSPLQVIQEHSQTEYHALRFGGLRLSPLPETEPPSEIGAHEARYVEQLYEAYSDHKRSAVACPTDLDHHPVLKKHFYRARVSFYRAEALRVMGRDASVDGCEFDKLQQDIFDGVVDVAEGDHKDGLARVKATTNAAHVVPLDAHVLYETVRIHHRHGICHQLANEDKLIWVPK